MIPRKRAKPRRRRPELFTVGAAPRVKYRDRPRDTPRMLWVKSQPCCAYTIAPLDHCEGVVEADHAGVHGLSRKCDDSACIPLCVRHHRSPGLRSILHGQLGPGELRTWLNQMVAFYQRLWDVQQRRAA